MQRRPPLPPEKFKMITVSLADTQNINVREAHPSLIPSTSIQKSAKHYQSQGVV